MKKFVITAFMKNGEVWETTRHTEEGSQSVLESIVKDSEVETFTIAEYN